MIGFLSGTLGFRTGDRLILLVGGVGYAVSPTQSVLSRLPETGNRLELFIYTHVREDQLTLFGFESREEQSLFELMLSVSGIGPKTALAILSRGSADQIRTAVSMADVDFFLQTPGVGKKSAQRIIIDLKSKLGDLAELDLSGQSQEQNEELIGALRSMGFKPDEIKPILRNIDHSLPLPDQIRVALRGLNG